MSLENRLLNFLFKEKNKNTLSCTLCMLSSRLDGLDELTEQLKESSKRKCNAKSNLSISGRNPSPIC